MAFFIFFYNHKVLGKNYNHVQDDQIPYEVIHNTYQNLNVLIQIHIIQGQRCRFCKNKPDILARKADPEFIKLLIKFYKTIMYTVKRNNKTSIEFSLLNK